MPAGRRRRDGSDMRTGRGWRVLVVLAFAAVAVVAQAAPAMAATFTVTTTADSGAGSLRQAITDSNGAGPGNTIAFAIPGSGPHVISPTTALPSIFQDGTAVDGCTQPGADCSNLPLTLQIQLHGQALATGHYGVTIRGISFTGPGSAFIANRVARSGEFVLPDDVTIERNYIGLAPDGSAVGKPGTINLSPGNRNINPPDRLRVVDNVIGGNTTTAVNATAQGFSRGRPITGLRISGNVIGLDPTGTQTRPNAGDGIAIDISSDARVVGNTVAGNTGVGIRHRGRTQAIPGSDPAGDPGLLIQGNVVEGNAGGGIAIVPEDPILVPASADPYSGPVSVLGNTIRNNGVAGIWTVDAADAIRPNLRIGGTAPGEANTIAGNDGPGVAVGDDEADTSVAVSVRGNSIYGNAGPGIDLASDGPTPNAPAGEVRTGPNLLTNFPVIGSLAHGSLVVGGTYEGAADTVVTLDFYKSETADGPQTWVGSTDVTTDAGGTAAYSAEFEPSVPEGWFVHATATADGSTSEFGEAAQVPPVPPTPPVPTVPPAPTTPAPVDAPSTDTDTDSRRRIGKPALRLKQKVSRTRVPAGDTATFSIGVRNPSRRALRNVRTCDRLPAGLVYASATRGARLSEGRYCWTAKRLAAGASRTYKLTVRALRGTSGRKVNGVTASSPDARTARASRAVRVVDGDVAGGGVTG